MATSSLSITPLLMWALGFFIVAVIAGVLGFGGIAGAASGIAQILFVGFMILAAIALVVGIAKRA